MIRLLAIDIDGTLVDAENRFTDATRDALARAAEAGVRLALVTGRQYGNSLPLARALGIDAPLVLGSGALIKDPADHRTLYRASFEESLLPTLLEILDARGHQPVLYTDSYAEGGDGPGCDFHYAGGDSPREELAEYLAKNKGRGRIHPQLVSDPPQETFGGFAMGECDEMRALAVHIEESLPGQLYLHVLRSPRYRGWVCEFAPAGVNKWTGIMRLAEQWDIAPDHIAAVGDDVNDIPMICGAGLGVAMGNARAEAKAVADRVAPSQQDDGLVEVVRWILQ